MGIRFRGKQYLSRNSASTSMTGQNPSDVQEIWGQRRWAWSLQATTSRDFIIKEKERNELVPGRTKKDFLNDNKNKWNVRQTVGSWCWRREKGEPLALVRQDRSRVQMQEQPGPEFGRGQHIHSRQTKACGRGHTSSEEALHSFLNHVSQTQTKVSSGHPPH